MDIAGDGAGRHPVLGVIGGSGGVGASSFAAVLAVTAEGSAVLVDLDVTSGGVDVLLGIEDEPGARWSRLHVAGGRLDPRALAEGLPRAGPVSVLAADTVALDPEAVAQVVTTAAQLAPVVVDLPRGDCAERAAALPSCDLLVMVVRADVTGLVAAHSVVAALPTAPMGVVVRSGDVAAGEAANLVGLPLLGELPATTAGSADPLRPPRAAARLAAGLWKGLVAATPRSVAGDEAGRGATETRDLVSSTLAGWSR